MWPRTVAWQDLRFGVEIEFVDGTPTHVELLPNWKMALDELQDDTNGCESGSELQSPPLRWKDREQIRTMLDHLKATGAAATWSCGLHVHVGLEPWGESAVLPLVDAALTCQHALQSLLQMAEHRSIFSPDVTPAMRERYVAKPEREALVHTGRPQSHRCGINAGAWYDYGTVEIRYANGSLDYDAVVQAVELCLRFVAAVGAGQRLPAEPAALAEALGAAPGGYPPPLPAPLWHREREWLEDMLRPVLGPLLEKVVPGEIHHIRPTSAGLMVAIEPDEGPLNYCFLHPSATGWNLVASPGGAPLVLRRATAGDSRFIAATLGLADVPATSIGDEVYLLLNGSLPVGTVTLRSDGSVGFLGVSTDEQAADYESFLRSFADIRAWQKGL